ncbi:hypothetical protein ABEB36_010716 [Hypothenemus hampei]|uniref:Retrotransposon gag domain-containing protein n=1 Tax=Hypothenemus hampei TaxID=57062 RepID=A0ABD1ECX0_HYPHA
MTDRSRRITGRDASPLHSHFLPNHNSTSLPKQPLVPFDLSLPANVADKVRSDTSSPAKRLVLTIDDGPNTPPQKVLLRDIPPLTHPGPSIFDPDHPLPIITIADTDTQTGVPKMYAGNDTTLGDLHNRPQQVVTPRFLEPPTFHPRFGQASTFLNKFELAAGRNGWDAALRLMYLGNYLEGPASKWYQAYFNDPANVTSTWETVKTDFRREFVGEDYLKELQRKLFSPDEANPNIPFDTFKMHFENGLHPSLQDHFSLAAGAAVDFPSLLKAEFTLVKWRMEVKMEALQTRIRVRIPGRQWYNSPAHASGDRWNTKPNTSFPTSQQSSSLSYHGRSQDLQQNFKNNDSQRPQIKQQADSGPRGAYRGNRGDTQQSLGNGRRSTNSYVPNTRSWDGRPICQDWNKPPAQTPRPGFFRTNSLYVGFPKRGRTTPIGATEEVVLQSSCAKILTIVGKLNGRGDTPLVIDTGATYTIIEADLATDIKPLRNPMILAAVGRFQFTPIGVSIIRVEFAHISIQMPALVGHNVGRPLLFGSDFLCRFNVDLRYSQKKLTIESGDDRVCLTFTVTEPPPLEYLDESTVNNTKDVLPLEGIVDPVGSSRRIKVACKTDFILPPNQTLEVLATPRRSFMEQGAASYFEDNRDRLGPKGITLSAPIFAGDSLCFQAETKLRYPVKLFKGSTLGWLHPLDSVNTKVVPTLCLESSDSVTHPKITK